jgi:pyrimidine deaminase RibD-like protein
VHSSQNAVTDLDKAYMRQALQLAQRGVGHTHPNPAVGCVIVKDGKVRCTALDIQDWQQLRGNAKIL